MALRSVGMYLPDREVPNAALRERFATTAPGVIDKLETASGIRTRWYAPEEWATSDLAVRAARQALDRAAVDPRDVDLIVLGTDSPDYVTPATSVVVQHKLGATRAGTFDVGCACASFPTALAAASSLAVVNGALRNVLVVGAYMMHKLADPDDPTTFFYGDGAGAVLLQPSEEAGILGVVFRADGAYARHWAIASGGTAEPATEAAVREGRTRVRMRERYPAEVNEDGWPDLVRRVCDQAGFAVDALDLVLFTQVRFATIERVMDRLGLPMRRTHTVMHKWGYTGSACLPMALDDALREGRVSAGDRVVMVGSGVGYNQAAVALRVTRSLAGAR
ncbi:MAG TPA: ketoacyl-ACP synthase III [Polyangiaceae bacterium]